MQSTCLGVCMRQDDSLLFEDELTRQNEVSRTVDCEFQLPHLLDLVQMHGDFQTHGGASIALLFGNFRTIY